MGTADHHDQLSQRFFRLLLVFALLLGCRGLGAAVLPLDALPDGPLGLYASILPTTDKRLTLEQARQRFADGQGLTTQDAVPAFGIDANEVWMRLSLRNPSDRAKNLALLSGMSWTDHLDVYVLHRQRVIGQWLRGDAIPGAKNLVLGLGYGFPLELPPGDSEILLHAHTADPLLLPVELIPGEQLNIRTVRNHYAYGLLYGFLLALIAYNGMLYLGLRERSYLYYALYLGTFIALNLAYTGHGLALLWADNPYLQRYVILLLMVIFACGGMLFADRFLDLSDTAPREHRAVQVLMAGGLSAILLCIVGDLHALAARVAFTFVVLFSFIMVALGALAIRRGLMAGRFFLGAALCGMLGTATTAFAIWGVLPFNLLSFHSAEIGILMEATLLGLALAHQVRAHREARQRAEALASIDALTGLHNRRAFSEMGEWSWSMCSRKGGSLSLIILDIDHFKRINDTYGHDGGDQMLVAVSQTLSDCCRASDLLARWGGEEFVVLLPDTGLIEACTTAERLRQAVAGISLTLQNRRVSPTISLGVAERGHSHSLDELLNEADRLLYTAKRAGRNRAISKLSPATQMAA